jgi:hypothetical protein
MVLGPYWTNPVAAVGECGLLGRGGAANNEVTILPRGRDALEMFFAALFVYVAEGAEQAARATRALARSPSIVTG